MRDVCLDSQAHLMFPVDQGDVDSALKSREPFLANRRAGSLKSAWISGKTSGNLSNNLIKSFQNPFISGIFEGLSSEIPSLFKSVCTEPSVARNPKPSVYLLSITQ